MGQNNRWFLIGMFGLAMLGGILAVTAQDQTAPWPPAPVRRSADDNLDPGVAPKPRQNPTQFDMKSAPLPTPLSQRTFVPAANPSYPPQISPVPIPAYVSAKSVSTQDEQGTLVGQIRKQIQKLKPRSTPAQTEEPPLAEISLPQYSLRTQPVGLNEEQDDPPAPKFPPATVEPPMTPMSPELQTPPMLQSSPTPLPLEASSPPASVMDPMPAPKSSQPTPQSSSAPAPEPVRAMPPAVEPVTLPQVPVAPTTPIAMPAPMMPVAQTPPSPVSASQPRMTKPRAFKMLQEAESPSTLIQPTPQGPILAPAPQGPILAPAPAPLPPPMHFETERNRVPEKTQALRPTLPDSPALMTVAPTITEPLDREGPPLPALQMSTQTPSTGSAWKLLSPKILAEKRGPASLRTGETAIYHIALRNAGDDTAWNMVVEEGLPAGIRAVAADPVAYFKNGKVRWHDLSLNPGEERMLRVQVQAIATVDIPPMTSLSLTARTGDAPVRTSNGISVQILGPSTVSLGSSANFQIMVTNQGKEPVRNLHLLGQLPDGLQHPMGKLLETDIEEIQPGASKTINTATKVVQAGRQIIVVKLRNDAGSESIAQSTIDIANSSSLILQQAASTRLITGQETEVRFEVHNKTEQIAKQVNVQYTIPEGLEFVGASNRGQYQSNTRTIYWLIDQIPANQAQALAFKAQPTKPGQYPAEIRARMDGGEETKSSSAITIDGNPDLIIRVLGRDNPVEVGKETIYEIVVSNIGSKSADNVVLQATFPEGLLPKMAQGPTRFSGAGRLVHFEPVVRIAPQGSQVFRISALVQASGEQKLRISVTSSQNPAPVQRDHSTWAWHK